MASQNYYNNIDAKYLELGIALSRIDRMNPGLVPFSIPILTPDLQKENSQTSKVVQRDKSNIMNENKDAVDVSDIEISNSILIEIPVELCSLPGAYYDITGSFTSGQDLASDGAIAIQGSMSMTGRSNIDGSLKFHGNISGRTMYYGIPNANFSGTGGINGSSSLATSGTITGRIISNNNRGDIDVRNMKGTIGLTLNSKSRYIEAGSRWLIAFIGGDLSAPAVVCRVPSEAGIPVTEASLQERQAEENPEINNNKYDTVVQDQNTYDEPYPERTEKQLPTVITKPKSEKDTRTDIIDVDNPTAISTSYEIYSVDVEPHGYEPTTVEDSPEDDEEFNVMYDTFIFDFDRIEVHPGEEYVITDDRIKSGYTGTFKPIPSLVDIHKGAIVVTYDGYCTVNLLSINQYPIIGTVQIRGSEPTYLLIREP